MVSGATLHGDVPWPDVARLASELSVAGVSMAPTPEMWVAAMQGDFDAARAISDDFIEGQRERGLTLNVFTHCLARGYIEHVAGAAERAVEALREGWDGLGALGERGIRSRIGGVLGEMLARLGRLDEAEAILDDAIALSTPDDWVTVEAVMMGRAFVASGRGDHDLACELAREAMELVDSLEYVTLQQDARMSRADILLAAGRRDEARTALAWAREAAARKGSTVLVERADRLTAALDA